MNIQEKVFTHQTQEIIQKYLTKEINNKLDILNYYKKIDKKTLISNFFYKS